MGGIAGQKKSKEDIKASMDKMKAIQDKLFPFVNQNRGRFGNTPRPNSQLGTDDVMKKLGGL